MMILKYSHMLAKKWSLYNKYSTIPDCRFPKGNPEGIATFKSYTLSKRTCFFTKNVDETMFCSIEMF